MKTRANPAGPILDTVVVTTKTLRLAAVKILSSSFVGHGITGRIRKGVLLPPDYACTYPVAVKVFERSLSETRDEMLRREMRAVGLSHRFILPYIGLLHTQSLGILVTQFMPNGNLLQYFRAHKDADRQHMILQLAEAVHFLHTCVGVVHGDLKCENVLVSDEGNAQLGDFGLCTAVGEAGMPHIGCSSSKTFRDLQALRDFEAGEWPTLTSSDFGAQYTVAFAAPELLQGLETGDLPRSKTRETDVYAFGMLVLQAFTEKHPWAHLRTDDDNVFKVRVMLQVCTRGIHPRPGQDVTLLGLTDEWWAVCLKCWAFDPAYRPSMHQLWEDLAVHPIQPIFGPQLVDPLDSPSLGLCDRGSYHATAAAQLPCGTRTVWGSSDGTIRISDMRTGQTLIGPVHAHPGCGVDALAVSPDGLYIASMGLNSALCVWDVHTGAPVGPRGPKAPWGSIRGLAFSPDGTRIATGRDNFVLVWQRDSHHVLRRPERVLEGHTDGVTSVAFQPGSRLLASGSDDKTIRLWHSTTGTLEAVFVGHSGMVTSVSFSHDGRWLLSGSWDGTVRVWDIPSRRPVRTLHGHNQDVWSVSMSPAGTHIASRSSNSIVIIWDVRNTRRRVRYSARWLHCFMSFIEFSPSGKELVACLSDFSIRIWNT